MEEHTWITYNGSSTTAKKWVQAGPIHVYLTLQQNQDNTYGLIIEAGIESISVSLHSKTVNEAMAEADAFAKDYFLDRAKLLEEIAERI